MAFSVLVLHGPNLSLLAADEIDPQLEVRAAALRVELVVAQANGEEGLLDALHAHADDVDAVLVNPGALAPTAYALAEGLAQRALPAAEVLLTASTRGPSALTGVVAHQVHGEGVAGYLRALERLAPAEPSRKETEDEADELLHAAPTAPERGGKSIGRKKPAPTPAPLEAVARGKTIGRAAKKPEVATQAATPAAKGALTRAQVSQRISQKLKGGTTSEALAQWARDTWAALQKGAAVEPGAKDTIENVLLTLMAGAKASDAVLVAQMAKLDR